MYEQKKQGNLGTLYTQQQITTDVFKIVSLNHRTVHGQQHKIPKNVNQNKIAEE